MPRRLMAFLLDPGPRTGALPVVARLALAALFIPAGIGKYANHDAYIGRFDRWGFPAPGAMAYLVGAIEVSAGLLLLVGVIPRVAALVLAGNMVGALATAGRIDGGQNIWLPVMALCGCVLILRLGAGGLRLGR